MYVYILGNIRALALCHFYAVVRLPNRNGAFAHCEETLVVVGIHVLCGMWMLAQKHGNMDMAFGIWHVDEDVACVRCMMIQRNLHVHVRCGVCVSTCMSMKLIQVA